MLCDICQTKPAKIFYTEIVNGEKKEQHLCEDCASEYTAVPLNEIMGGAQGQLSIGSILSGILSKYAKDNSEEGSGIQKRIDTRCPECGTSESEFLKIGRLGCPVCYNAFSNLITKNFKTMQGGLQHTGKEPAHAKFIEISDNFQSMPAILTPAADGVDESSMSEQPAKETSKKAASKTAGKKKAEKTSNKAALSKDAAKEENTAVNELMDEAKLADLKNRLALALEEENYELAAELRDIIHSADSKKDAEDTEKTSKGAAVKSAKTAKAAKKPATEKEAAKRTRKKNSEGTD